MIVAVKTFWTRSILRFVYMNTSLLNTTH